MLRRGQDWWGVPRQAWSVEASIGMVWRGWTRQARWGKAWHGAVMYGLFGIGRRGIVRLGVLVFGTASLGRLKMKGVLKMVYSWSYNKPVAAEVAGKRLEELTAIHGTVTPKIILEDSRDENAPLHPCFEWDDGKAAEAYRLRQAHEILISLKVTVESGEKEIETRAFVNVAEQDEKNGAFIAVGAALSKEETRQAVLTRALAELTYFKRKYESLMELSEVFSAIDRAVKKIKKRSKKAA